MKQRFASVVWESRWNKSETSAMSDQSANDVMAVGWFGSVSFDLDKDEDVAAIVKKTRLFADMIEELKSGYDKALS